MNKMSKKTDLKEILRPLNVLFIDIDKNIKEQLITGVPLIDESSLHIFVGGGKKIRASLVILCGGLAGVIPDGIIPIAAAAEIVHAATLIHDDIIDQALFR